MSASSRLLWHELLFGEVPLILTHPDIQELFGASRFCTADRVVPTLRTCFNAFANLDEYSFSYGWRALSPFEKQREFLSRVAVGRFVQGLCENYTEYVDQESRQRVVLDAALEARLAKVRVEGVTVCCCAQRLHHR
jgi:hypothetical protein